MVENSSIRTWSGLSVPATFSSTVWAHPGDTYVDGGAYTGVEQVVLGISPVGDRDRLVGIYADRHRLRFDDRRCGQ